MKSNWNLSQGFGSGNIEEGMFMRDIERKAQSLLFSNWMNVGEMGKNDDHKWILCLVMGGTVMELNAKEISDRLASLMEKISLVLDMLSFYCFWGI